MAKLPATRCRTILHYLAIRSSRAILAKVRALERRNLFFARDSGKSARIGARNTAIREHLRLKRARIGAQTVIWDRFCRKHAKNGCWRGIRECLEENQSLERQHCIWRIMCYRLPRYVELYARFREQGDAPQAGPSTLISGPACGALLCEEK